MSRTHTLAWWLTADRSEVSGDRLHVPDKRGVLIFQDNGADVLLVAHLDHVGERYTKPAFPVWFGWRYVQHVSLDDRLGCWAIERLHASGIKADLLYTDCEETGRTTAAEFTSPRPYKFILSMDRRGTDAVLYQYLDARRWKRRCKRHFGDVSHGSFSCIASMEHLGVCGVNVGVGYYEHNTANCWADLYQTERQLRAAAAFIRDARHKQWRFVAPQRPVTRYSGTYSGRDIIADAWARWALGEEWPARHNGNSYTYDVARDAEAKRPTERLPAPSPRPQGTFAPTPHKVRASKSARSRVYFMRAENAFTGSEQQVHCDESALILAEDSGRDVCTGPCQCPIDAYDYCDHGWPSRTAAVFG